MLEAKSIALVNPFRDGAEIADSKFSTFQRWRAVGLTTPDTFLIKRPLKDKDIDKAFSAVKSPLIVVQPDKGTEGEGVAAFHRDDLSDIRSHIGLLMEADDVIIREAVGNVFYQTGEPPEGLWLPDQGVAPYRGRG